MSEIVLFGIKVRLFRKKTRNIIIRIGIDGRVSMTLPVGVAISEAEYFFKRKLPWITEKLSEAQKFSENRKTGFGSKISIFGEGAVIRPLGKKGSPRLSDGSLLVYAPTGDEEQIKKAVYRYAAAEVSERSAGYFKKWGEATGLYPSSVAVHLSRTRWGSCNVKSGKINLSLFLAFLPEKCLDYTVLHEVAHLRYGDHGKDFKAFLTRYMPDWKEVRRFMNERAIRI